MAKVVRPIAMIAQVRNVVKAQLDAIEAAKNNQRDAETAASLARDTTYGVRGDALVALAAASTKGGWKIADIDAGVKEGIEQFVKGRNIGENTQATFASTMKLAMHPNVCAKVPAMFDLAAKAFKSEEGKPDAEQPIRATYSRAYHLATRADGLFGMLRDKPDATPTVASLAATCAQRVADKPRDPKRAAAALKAMVRKLKELEKEFPAAEIASMREFAEKLDPAKLQAAHDRMKAGAALQNGATKRKRNAPPPPASVDDATDELLN